MERGGITTKLSDRGERMMCKNCGMENAMPTDTQCWHCGKPLFAEARGSAPDRDGYKANFLWPHKEKSVEEAGYEFANARTEGYRKIVWGVLLERIKAQNAGAQRPLNCRMTYSEIKAEIEAAPMTYLPGLLVAVVKTSLSKKVFKPGGAARVAQSVEDEALGKPEDVASGSLKQPCCAAPCVVNTIQTADKATCVYLRDGTKVTVERDGTTKGPAWLKVSQQARITTAQHNDQAHRLEASNDNMP